MSKNDLGYKEGGVIVRYHVPVVLFAALVLVFAVGFASAAPKPVVLLKFDEGQGDVTRDSSGNGYDGKLINSPKWVDGRSGKALYFTGSAGNYSNVELPIGPSDIGNAGTIMFWFKADWETVRQRTLLEATRTATNRAFFIGWGEEGSFLEFSLEDGVDADWETEATGHLGEPQSGKWYSIAAVWDFTDLSKAATRLYVNGEKWAEVVQSATALDGFEAFTIGSQRYDYWSTGSADGTIDDFMVFAAALSDAEIEQAYKDALK